VELFTIPEKKPGVEQRKRRGRSNWGEIKMIASTPQISGEEGREWNTLPSPEHGGGRGTFMGAAIPRKKGGKGN